MANITELQARLARVRADDSLDPANRRLYERELQREIEAARAAMERKPAEKKPEAPEPSPALETPKRKPRGRRRGGAVFDDDPGLAAEAEELRAKSKAAGEGSAAPLPPCPITPLGHLGPRYFFITPSGQYRDLNYRDLGGAAGLLNVFDGYTDYLRAAWPRRDRDGAILDDFNAREATAGLMRMCAEVGIWHEPQVRRYGVWRDGNRLLAHSGAVLTSTDGEQLPAGRIIGDALYPAFAKLAPPAFAAADAATAKALRQDFRLWRFEPVSPDLGASQLGADLLFCAASLALLGAGPSWRVHTLVKAIHGSGKSALLEFVGAILGVQAHIMNNLSEAGLRQTLTNEARAALIDEAESDPAGMRMGQIIETIRQMSGGKGVEGVRGTADGVARHFQIAGCIFLACINPPPLLPQDASRILVLEMLQHARETEQAVRAAIERAEGNSAAFRARALAGWPRFLENLSHLKTALLDLGASSRQGDQLASLLAAGAMMTDDEPLDAAEARHLAEAVSPMLERMQAEESENGDAWRCWRTLLSERADAWRSGDLQTVASLLRAARDHTGTDARQALTNFGLRLVERPSPGMPEAPCLYVARDHNFLQRLFANTPWRGGGWASSLARLDGARPSKTSLWVGVKTRAVAIPLHYLPDPANPDKAEPPPAHDAAA
jgi:hypothetical protein